MAPKKSTALSVYDHLDRLNFRLLHYESPFRVSINPNYSEWMNRYCSEWAIWHTLESAEHHYAETIRHSDTGLFSAVCFPSANWHRLEKLMKWSTMFFIGDDLHDIIVIGKGDQMRSASSLNGNDGSNNGKTHGFCCDRYLWQHMTEMLDALSQRKKSCKHAQWPQFVLGVESLLKDIYFDYTIEQIQRSTRLIKKFIEGNIKEIDWFKPMAVTNGQDHNNNKEDANDSESSSINWNSYMKTRLKSVGGQMAMQLVEYATETALTDFEFDHPLLKRLERVISEQMILINDHFTFRKEVAENDFKFSQMKHAYPVLVSQGMTLQEAVDRVHSLIQQNDKILFELMNLIRTDQELNQDPSSTKRLRIFLDGISELMGGFWRHAITARRYHGTEFVGAISPNGHFVYDQNQTVIINKLFQDNQYPYQWLKEIPENVQPSFS